MPCWLVRGLFTQTECESENEREENSFSDYCLWNEAESINSNSVYCLTVKAVLLAKPEPFTQGKIANVNNKFSFGSE